MIFRAGSGLELCCLVRKKSISKLIYCLSVETILFKIDKIISWNEQSLLSIILLVYSSCNPM